MKGLGKYLLILGVICTGLMMENKPAAAEVYDYTRGLLDDKKIIEYNDLPEKAYDNSETTYASTTTTRYTVRFTEPINISAYYYKGAQSASFKIEFQNDDGTIGTKTGSMGVGYVSANLENVLSIQMYRASGSGSLNEIDFFGKYHVAPPPEVIDLKVNVTHEKVNLSWQLPTTEDLKHVNIYRDQVTKVSLIDKILGVSVAHAADTKIFETNGTYFNDFTAQPGETYEYTLTTALTSGEESGGVTINVDIPEEPEPTISGGQYVAFDDKYIFKWTEPTQGKVKILVDGKLYTTVDASTKQIEIPKKDLTFNSADVPNVKLVPVSKTGKEGKTVSPAGKSALGEITKAPFTAKDLLIAGLALLGVVGAFLFLTLAFKVLPKLIETIRSSFSNEKRG